MTATFPASVRVYTTKTDFVNTVVAADVDLLQDEVNAVETYVGANPHIGSDGTVYASLAARLSALETSASRSGTIVSHSSLTGLANDDHTQYLNVARHDTTTRHGASVVDHTQIGNLTADSHTQYLNTARHATTDHSFLLPAGTLLAFGGGTAPSGFLAVDGSAVSRTTFSALFANIGTRWGAGDGVNTFNLPPKGVVFVGLDAGQAEFNTVGKTGGEKTHHLLIGELPNHDHSTNTSYPNTLHQHTVSGTTNAAAPDHFHNVGGSFATIGTNKTDATAVVVNALLQSGSVATSAASAGIIHSHTNNFNTGDNVGDTAADHFHVVQGQGNDTAHNNLQPYGVVLYIIKT